jgi:hypothetical protein
MASVVVLLGAGLELVAMDPDPVDSASPPHAARASGSERAAATKALRRVRFMVELLASGWFDTSCSERQSCWIALSCNRFRN